MMLPSINPSVNRKRELVNEKAVSIAYPASLDSPVLDDLNSHGGSPLMDNIARSVQAKFQQYREESEIQRRRMFPYKDSPFKK